MKSNNFLGLVGTAATMFALFSVACAAPATVSRSVDGDDDDTSTSRRDNDEDDDSTSTKTPVSSSTSTTTGTTTTTPPSTPTTPTAPTTDPQSCSKLGDCAGKSTSDAKYAWLIASFAGDQKICATALLACNSGIVDDFLNGSCSDLNKCCTQMGSNGNGAQANACRATANADDGARCKSQLGTYESQGLCR